MNQRDLFISHSSGDGEVARELRAELETAGYSTWMAPDDVTGTVPWAEQILEAIASSRAMLVLVSSHANRSAHVSREVGLANGRNRAILPIRIEPVATEGALAYHLEGLQRVDAFPPPVVQHVDRILRRLARIVPLEEQPSAPAPLPLVAALASLPPLIPPAPTTAVDPLDETHVQPVPVPARPASAQAGPTPAKVPPSRVTARRVPRRWPPSRGIAAAILTLAALISLGTGVLVLGPGTGTPTNAPPGSVIVVGSPPASPEPLSFGPFPTVEPSASPPTGSFGPSLSPTGAAGPVIPEPTPTRRPTVTPRPTPRPTVKVTKPPTQPPATPAPTPTPPPTNPARITSHANGSTISGSSVTFIWNTATGPTGVRYYAMYVGSTPPDVVCPSGQWCKEPPGDSYAPMDIGKGTGLPSTQHSLTINGLPADGSTIYVRLLTKFDPDSGTLSWRDYSFRSNP